MTQELADVLHEIIQGIADGSIVSNTNDFHELIRSKVIKDEVPTPPPHYEEIDSKPVWVTYENGLQINEPYRHQDDRFSNMCVSPNWCRCSQ